MTGTEEIRGQVEDAILAACRDNGDTRIGGGFNYLAEEVAKRLPGGRRADPQILMQVLWSLVARELVYLDVSQRAPENWPVMLTERGAHVLAATEPRPELASQYVDALQQRIADVSDVVLLYVDQSLRAFNAEAYVGSAILIGVAAEAAFMELALVFVEWLPEESARKFRTTLANKANTVKKFEEFRKRLETFKPQMPSDLVAQSDLRMNSILNLLREDRNDAGHPTGRRFSREEAQEQLQLFSRLAPRMADLKRWLQNELDEGRSGSQMP